MRISRPRFGAAIASVALVLASAPPASAAVPYRVSQFALVELTRSQLPYTGQSVRSLPPARGPADAQGIPVVLIGSKAYYHPVAIALGGLRLIDSYQQTGTVGYLDWARKYAAKLRQIAIASGGGLYLPYWFDYPSEHLRAPWYSAMAQGLGLSLFVRLYRETGSPAHLETAHRLFDTFRRIGPQSRPWIQRVDANGYLWLEEYPRADRLDRVLNGFLYATFGVYDYWQLTHWPMPATVLRGAMTTMRAHVWRYRVPGGVSLYCLYHRTQHVKYHLTHIWQLAALGRMSGDSYFTTMSARFAADYP